MTVLEEFDHPTSEDAADISAKVRWLMDRAEIQDLQAAYARTIDHGDLDGLRQFYHDGSIDEHGIFSGSGDEFALAMTAPDGNALRFKTMQHHSTTLSMDIDGDDAEVEAYFLCVCVPREGNSLEFTSGRTADRFARRDGRWGLVNRQVIMDWTMSLPEPDPVASDPKFVKGKLGLDDISRQLLPRLAGRGFVPTRPRR